MANERISIFLKTCTSITWHTYFFLGSTSTTISQCNKKFSILTLFHRIECLMCTSTHRLYFILRCVYIFWMTMLMSLSSSLSNARTRILINTHLFTPLLLFTSPLFLSAALSLSLSLSFFSSSAFYFFHTSKLWISANFNLNILLAHHLQIPIYFGRSTWLHCKYARARIVWLSKPVAKSRF